MACGSMKGSCMNRKLLVIIAIGLIGVLLAMFCCIPVSPVYESRFKFALMMPQETVAVTYGEMFQSNMVRRVISQYRESFPLSNVSDCRMRQSIRRGTITRGDALRCSILSFSVISTSPELSYDLAVAYQKVARMLFGEINRKIESRSLAQDRNAVLKLERRIFIEGHRVELEEALSNAVDRVLNGERFWTENRTVLQSIENPTLDGVIKHDLLSRMCSRSVK